MAALPKEKSFIDENGINWYNCEHENCEFKTKHPSNLAVHKREHIGFDIRYFCTGCSYKFTSKANLKNHVLRSYVNSAEIHGFILCSDHTTSKHLIRCHFCFFFYYPNTKVIYIYFLAIIPIRKVNRETIWANGIR